MTSEENTKKITRNRGADQNVAKMEHFKWVVLVAFDKADDAQACAEKFEQIAHDYPSFWNVEIDEVRI